jgi:hypothetical protein
MIRAAIYIRDDAQAVDPRIPSAEDQGRRCLAFAEARGWFVMDVFRDRTYRAGQLEPPQLKKLLNRIDDREIDVLLTYGSACLSNDPNCRRYLRAVVANAKAAIQTVVPERDDLERISKDENKP